MNRIKLRCLLTALVAVIATPVFADNPLHGRVSHDAGGLLVRGAGANEWTHATTNTIVLPGDTLWIDETGVGEVELPQGNFLRLADTSKIELVAVSPSIALRAWAGSYYVQRVSRSGGGLVVETPAGTVDIQPDSSVRIDVLPAGNTTVTVRWGQAGVRTPQGGAVNIATGNRVYIDPGLLPSSPVPFDRNVEDSFDQWSRERSEYIATGGVPAEVTVAPATLGVSDLRHYGEWVYVDQRPYWRPTIVTEYVPYRTGYWNYVPAYGHVWVGTTPFCYVTSHYGRWSYVNNYGWCWSYDPVWRPAWAVTVRYGDYFAWAPCDYYNRPVLVTDSAYFNIGGVRFSVSSTSWVGYNHLYHGPRYVSPWYSNPYYGHHHGPDTVVNINIWNIDSRDRRPAVNPFPNDRFTVRDYSPSRSIRGVDSIEAGGRSAVERAQYLEQRLGRSEFSAVSRAQQGDRTRTGYTERERGADVRSVRVQDRGPSAFTRIDTHDAARGSVRGGETTTINNGAAARTDVRPLNRVQRGEEGVRTAAPLDSESAGRATVERTTVRGEGASISRGETRVPRSETQQRGTSVRTAPNVERGGRQVERTAVPETAYQRGGTVQRGGESTPAPVIRQNVTAPRESVRSRAPETTVAPRVERSAPPSVRYTAPRSGNTVVRQSVPVESRVAPRMSAPAPTYSPRSTPRMESAPRAESAPRYSAPRFESAPRREPVRVQPVQPRQESSIGRSAPAPRPTVQLNAPQSVGRQVGGVSVRPQGFNRGEAPGRGR